MTGPSTDPVRDAPAKLSRHKFLKGSAAAVALAALSGTLVFKSRLPGPVSRPGAGQTIVNPVLVAKNRYQDMNAISVVNDDVTIVNPDIEGFHHGIGLYPKADGTPPRNARVIFDPAAPGASTARGFVDNVIAVGADTFDGLEVGGVGGGGYLRFRDNSRNIELYGGTNLNAHHNDILGPSYVHPIQVEEGYDRPGSIVGIMYLPDINNPGPREYVARLDDNRVGQVAEECLSLDCRGNEPARMCMRERDSVRAVEVEQKYIDLNSGNWTAQPTPMYASYSMIFLSGAAQGKRVLINGREGQRFDVSDPDGVLGLVRAGDIVVIGAPFINSRIARNTVDGRWSMTPVAFHGASLSSIIENNVITPSNSYREPDLAVTHLRDPGDNLAAYQAIRVSSLGGLDATGSVTGLGRWAPDLKCTVRDNRITGGPGDISFTLFQYGAETYTSRNYQSGNAFEAGGQVWTDAFSPTPTNAP
jgi:hypothetical protein